MLSKIYPKRYKELTFHIEDDGTKQKSDKININNNESWVEQLKQQYLF